MASQRVFQSGEEHKYSEFIQRVIDAGHRIEWTATEATIYLAQSRWKVQAKFSYNEPKIYFMFGHPEPCRVLSSGVMSAEFIDLLDVALLGVQGVIREYEG